MNETTNNEQRQAQWHPNRNYLTLSNGIVIDSCFPAGNISQANILSSSPLTIEVEGNPDVCNDHNSKYWLYFRLRGFRKDKPVKFILKNANHLRKYYGQTRYKAYMVYRQQQEQWQGCLNPIEITVVQNGHFQGSFSFQSDKSTKISRTNRSTNDLYPNKEEKLLSSTTGKEESRRGDCYFAMYAPYSYEELSTYLDKLRSRNSWESSKVYFHEETITYSYERRKISLLTITSRNNIESLSEKEPLISEEIFPFPKERPHKLKNNPVVIITARVHPSETSSSYFTQGVIQFLLGDCRASAILRQLFIFQIIPMLNPDGVEHGNFRFDHGMRNLNRYYGQSSIDKTPSIRAAQLLISYYKNRSNEQCQFTEFYQQTYSRLFMYVDVHGHCSPMSSFIYGNHTDKIQHLIENKTFCKLIQSNIVPGGFSKFQSEFSKKNMNLQEKYDDFSKQGAGRVFAGKADTIEQNIFHSYTLEVMPYWDEPSKRKFDQKGQKLTAFEYARQLGRAMMLSVLDLLDLNPESKFSESQMDRLRRSLVKEGYNEQLRKIFLYKRAESSVERFSYSQIAKARQNSSEKEHLFQTDYIQRWFHNQVMLRHLMEKTALLKEPKFLKFYQKIAKLMSLPNREAIESPRKDPKASSREKPRCQFSSRGEQQIPSLIRNSKYFLPRDEKRMPNNEERLIMINRKKQSKYIQKKLIAKHTIELSDEFPDCVPKKYEKTDKIQKDSSRFPKREFCIKKQSRKETAESMERYQNEVINKIQNSTGKPNTNAVFQIKVKEIKPKPKSNIRLQTEVALQPVSQTEGTEKIKNCNSQVGGFNIAYRNASQEGQKDGHRPSFIEEFIMKIREQRDVLQNNSSGKQTQKEQLRNKILKYRPSLKDMQEPQKNLLPVLRRNKIFTIVSQPCPKEGRKGYGSVLQNKKRATTIQSDTHIEELVAKTKKILGSNRKAEIGQEGLRKSQKFSQYAFL